MRREKARNTHCDGSARRGNRHPRSDRATLGGIRAIGVQRLSLTRITRTRAVLERTPCSIPSDPRFVPPRRSMIRARRGPASGRVPRTFPACAAPRATVRGESFGGSADSPGQSQAQIRGRGCRLDQHLGRPRPDRTGAGRARPQRLDDYGRGPCGPGHPAKGGVKRFTRRTPPGDGSATAPDSKALRRRRLAGSRPGSAAGWRPGDRPPRPPPRTPAR